MIELWAHHTGVQNASSGTRSVPRKVDLRCRCLSWHPVSRHSRGGDLRQHVRGGAGCVERVHVRAGLHEEPRQVRRPSLRARGPLPRKALGVASLRDAYPGEGECRQARSLQPGAWAPRPVAGGSPARPSAQRCSRVFPSTSMSVASSAPSSAPPSARASLAACLPFCLAQRPRWAIAFLPAAWLPAFRRLRSGLAQSERPCWQAGRLAAQPRPKPPLPQPSRHGRPPQRVPPRCGRPPRCPPRRRVESHKDTLARRIRLPESMRALSAVATGGLGGSDVGGVGDRDDLGIVVLLHG